MGNLTNYCGEEINPDNLWILYNALKIEKQYYPAQFKQFTPWYTDSLFEQIDIVNSQVQDFQNGLGLEGETCFNINNFRKKIRKEKKTRFLKIKLIPISRKNGKRNRHWKDSSKDSWWDSSQ